MQFFSCLFFVLGAAFTTAQVLPSYPECCPAGDFTGDISLACRNPEVNYYGNNQCYKGYVIQCNTTYLGDGSVFGYYFSMQGKTLLNAPVENIGNCYDTCHFYGEDDQAIALTVDSSYTTCSCFKPGGESATGHKDSVSLQNCPGAPKQPAACCTPYQGNLTDACVNPPGFGDKQCVDGFQILCGSSFNGPEFNNTAAANLAGCFDFCNRKATAVDLDPGQSFGVLNLAKTFVQNCTCAVSYNSVEVDTNQDSMGKVNVPLCTPCSTSCSPKIPATSSSASPRSTVPSVAHTSRSISSQATTSSSSVSTSSSSTGGGQGGGNGAGGIGGAGGQGGNGGQGASGGLGVYTGPHSNVAPFFAPLSKIVSIFSFFPSLAVYLFL